jgi:hypothetical protein
MMARIRRAKGTAQQGKSRPSLCHQPAIRGDARVRALLLDPRSELTVVSAWEIALSG